MYVPMSELSSDRATDNKGDVPFPVWISGPDVPWWGGVIDPALDNRPSEPTGLALASGGGGGGGEGDTYVRGQCVEWDPPPPLPAPVAAASAIDQYIVRTFVTVAGGDAARDESDDGEKAAARVSVSRSARFPTRVCQCDDWDIPSPTRGNDADPSADVLVTVHVVAENEAGRSPPAELSFTMPRSEISEWAEMREAKDGSCPKPIEDPLTTPLGLTVQRIPDADGGGVLVNWSTPLFEDDLLVEEDITATATASDKEENVRSVEGAGRRRLLQSDRETRSPNSSSGDNIGYQVTWIAWDEDTMPGVAAPVSVVLAADDGGLTRYAASPCGGDDEEGSCFYTGPATSLLLEGLSADSSYAFSVRALTPSGPRPMSAPVVLPARTAPISEEAPEGAPGDVFPTTTSESGQTVGEGSGANGSTPLPPAPPLENVIPLPLYEAMRLGSVYDQLPAQYRPTSTPAPYTQGSIDQNVGALATPVAETTTEVMEEGGINPYAGIGGFGYDGLGYGGLGLGGLGLLGAGLGGFRDGYGGYGAYNTFPPIAGNGSGGGQQTTTVGATTVNVNIVTSSSTNTSSERFSPPPPLNAPLPPPVTPPFPPPTPSLSASPPPASPALGATSGFSSNSDRREASPRGATTRDERAARKNTRRDETAAKDQAESRTSRSDRRESSSRIEGGTATVRVGGGSEAGTAVVNVGGHDVADDDSSSSPIVSSSSSSFEGQSVNVGNQSLIKLQSGDRGQTNELAVADASGGVIGPSSERVIPIDKEAARGSEKGGAATRKVIPLDESLPKDAGSRSDNMDRGEVKLPPKTKSSSERKTSKKAGGRRASPGGTRQPNTAGDRNRGRSSKALIDAFLKASAERLKRAQVRAAQSSAAERVNPFGGRSSRGHTVSTSRGGNA